MNRLGQIEVSIVIRTYGIEYLETILEIIEKQDTSGFVLNEIVIVNGNRSIDISSQGLVSSCKLIFVNNYLEPYKPGQALNCGIESTTGQVIAFLSGHSVPVGADWLKSLVIEFTKERVFCVCGAQTPRTESNLAEIIYRIFWYSNNSIGNIFGHFNMANSALEKSFWLKVKFDEHLDGCEDRLWAQVIKKEYGGRISFSSDAKVIHSHVNSVFATLRYFVWLSKVCLLSRRLLAVARSRHYKKTYYK